MKKTYFYSMMKLHNKATAILHNGYSDGTYYYYKSRCGNVWEVIHPLCGLAVTYGYTRKEAAEKAYSSTMAAAIEKAMTERGAELTAQFDKAIEALEANN